MKNRSTKCRKKIRSVTKHTNDWFWGTDVSFITSDGMAHIAVSFQSNRQFGWIHDLYVHPDVRRQGYATQLLALAEQEAKDRGMYAARLMVEYERKFAWDWYLRQGYSDDYDEQRFTDNYTELQKLL